MAKTGFVYHELYQWHDTGNYAGFMPYGFPLQPGMHFEHPETKRRFKNLLDASGYIKQLSIVEPRHATREALRRFGPQIIFVASGFDSSAFDPLGRMMMTSAGYAQLTHSLMTVAADLCGGNVVMAHEGGYSPEYVPLCGLAVLEAMSGISSGVEDPYLGFAAGMGRQDLQPEQQAVLDSVRSIHHL
jgi:acetoin utilization deacetylase AcuC-like enzyme